VGPRAVLDEWQNGKEELSSLHFDQRPFRERSRHREPEYSAGQIPMNMIEEVVL